MYSNRLLKDNFQDVSSRRIEVAVPAHSYQVIHIPILPIQIGVITARARIDNNADQVDPVFWGKSTIRMILCLRELLISAGCSNYSLGGRHRHRFE